MNEEYQSRTQNTGRWTNEEKNLFSLAYQWHGKDWQKLSQAIPTRSIRQIRSHAQKFEKSLLKQFFPAPAAKVFVLDSAFDGLSNYITRVCSKSYKLYIECQHQLINSQSTKIQMKFAFSPVKGELSHN
jgi:SHAQKYF class myb-like DNA-binding protein